MQPKEISCAGKTYSSVLEFSIAYSIHPSTTGRRLRDGWTPEEAARLSPRKNKGHGKKVVINGVSYSTIKEACEALKLDPKTIRARIQRGYSIEDAFEGNL